MVLNIGVGEGLAPKCSFYCGHLPNYIDDAQPPTKKQPFKTVLDHRWTHSIDILVPSSTSTNDSWVALQNETGMLRYARVHMKLADILQGEFFNQYVKTGSILMLSEGKAGVDNVFSLADGVLRLEVDKATYERLGLAGSAIRGEGRKHVKARYAIEANLRLPSMVRGKKGFERIIWACNNVLDATVTWLFYDMNAPTDGNGPIAAHQPVVKTVKPEVELSPPITVPRFPEIGDQEEHVEATELLEWLTLGFNNSPRLHTTDDIDPYIGRYKAPCFDSTIDSVEGTQSSALRLFRWHGFIPAAFASRLLLIAMKASGNGWFAMSARSFDGETYTILKTDRRAMTWTYAG